MPNNHTIPNSMVRAISRDVANSLKSRHPKIVRVDGKHQYTFLPDSPDALKIDTLKIVTSANPYWAFDAVDLTFLGQPVTANREPDVNIRLRYLEPEIRETVLRYAKSANIDTKDTSFITNDLLNTVYGRIKCYAFGFAICNDKANEFHARNIIRKLFRQDFPDAFAIALKNTGNITYVNQTIVADAYQHLEAYTQLYTINPLLGYMWTPFIRKGVENVLGVAVHHSNYSESVQNYFHLAGLKPLGIKNLYALARDRPFFFKTVITSLFTEDDKVGNGFSDTASEPLKAAKETGLTILLNNLTNITTFSTPVWKAMDHILGHRTSFQLQCAQWLPEAKAYLEVVRALTDRMSKREFYIHYDWFIRNAASNDGKLWKTVRDFKKRYPHRWKSKMTQWAVKRSTRWHIDQAREAERLNAIELEEFKLVIWKGLGADTSISVGNTTYSFHEILSQYDLFVEGNKLFHCVGSYANQCKTGLSHIFSVQKNGESDSTLELQKRGDRWIVNQNRGQHNAQPTKENVEAVQTFLKLLNSI